MPDRPHDDILSQADWEASLERAEQYDDMAPEADAQQDAEDDRVRESFLEMYASEFWSGPGSYND